jgi:hypothetical protein
MGPDESPYLFEATVDCPAMNWNPTYGNAGLPTLHEGITPMPLAGELTPSETDAPVPEQGRNARCYYRVPTKSLEVGLEQIPWDIDGEAYLSGSILQINYRGDTWWFGGGEFVLDEIEEHEFYPGGRARGHYDGEFWARNKGWARIKGEFDWCDPLRIGGCEHTPNRSNQQQWTLQSDWTNTSGTAAQCRMLHDTATGGLQVDMQIGSWIDADVSQIYALWCGWIGSIVNTNRFTFRTGGFTGAGSYGPYVVTDLVGDGFADGFYPQLNWELPLTLSWIFPNETQGCALSPSNGGAIQADPGTQCSYTVAEDRFTLDCDSATYWSSFFATPKPSGAFHFESDCTLVSR